MQETKVYGICHFMYPDSTDATSTYQVTQLAPTATLEVLKAPKPAELDQFSQHSDLITHVKKYLL